MDGGGLEAFAVFPQFPDLLERGCQDGVGRLYVECYDRGELLAEGARVSDVGALLAEVRNRLGDLTAIVCHRWREAELRQALEASVSRPVRLSFAAWATRMAALTCGNSATPA